jgi:hypothetical protein
MAVNTVLSRLVRDGSEHCVPRDACYQRGAAAGHGHAMGLSHSDYQVTSCENPERGRTILRGLNFQPLPRNDNADVPSLVHAYCTIHQDISYKDENNKYLNVRVYPLVVLLALGSVADPNIFGLIYRYLDLKDRIRILGYKKNLVMHSGTGISILINT